MTSKTFATGVRTSRQFDLASAGIAFLLWGGWAFWVATRASGKSHATPLVSGLTQGVGSFCITLVMVRLVSWLFGRFSTHPLRLVIPAILTVMITGTALSVAHFLVGTEDVVGTVAPALSVAFCFNLFTTVKIRNASRDEVSV
ncbi:MAG: hypothetical protein ABJZ55_25830 [Fuerstiella sp.]